MSTSGPRTPSLRMRTVFTKKKLHRAKDLRAAMKDWVSTFADDGPYVEDADALIKYLGRVVCDERDMAKAVGVVGWLEWVVGEGEDEVEGFAKKNWDDAVERVKEGVQKAAQDRGLRSIVFG